MILTVLFKNITELLTFVSSEETAILPVKQQLVINKDVHKFIRGFEAYGRHEAEYERVPQLESTDVSDSDGYEQPLLDDNYDIESGLHKLNEQVSTSKSVNKQSTPVAKSMNKNNHKGILKGQSPKKTSKAAKSKAVKTKESPKKSLKLTNKSDKVKSVKKSPKATSEKSKKTAAKKSPMSSPKKPSKLSTKKSPKSNKSSKIKRKK